MFDESHPVERMELRIPAPLPTFMRDWPQSLRPREMYFSAEEVELVYKNRDRQGVVLCLQNLSEGTLIPVVKENTLSDRVGEALVHHVAQKLYPISPEEKGALQGACAFIDSVEGFGREPEISIGALIGDVLQRAEDKGRWRRTRERFERLSDSSAELLAPLMIVYALAEQRLEYALEVWQQHRERIEETKDPLNRCCRMLVDLALGKGERVREHFLDWEKKRSYLDENLNLSALARCAGLELECFKYKLAFVLNRLRAEEPGARQRQELVDMATEAVSLGENTVAIKLALRVLLDPDIEVPFFTAAIDVLVGAGATPLAIDHMEGLVEKRSEPAFRLKLAEVHLWLGDTVHARDLVAPILEEETVWFEAIRVQAGCAVLEWKVKEAIPLLERLLEHRPKDRAATLWMGEAHYKRGDFVTGLQWLVRFNRGITAEYPIAKLLLGMKELGKQYPWIIRVVLSIVKLLLGNKEGSKGGASYKHRSIIRDVLSEPLDFEGMGVEEEREWLWRALQRFGGNRSVPVTVLGDTSRDLRAVPEVVSPRVKVVGIQHQIRYRDAEVVRRELDEFSQRFPDVPYGETYRAEIALWAGDYETAVEEFNEAWLKTETRWAYVGSGAAMVLQGRCEEALERFEDGRRVFGGYIDGEATLAYRGEAHWRLGNREQALLDLERAVELRPTRHGTRVNLALLYLELGREEDAFKMLELVVELAGPLLWEAHLALGLVPRVNPLPSGLKSVLKKAIELLAGNRSTHVVTFYGADGTWRRISSRYAGEIQTCASYMMPGMVPILLGQLCSELPADFVESGQRRSRSN